MAGRVQNFGVMPAHADGLIWLEEVVGCNGTNRRQAEPDGLFAQMFEQKEIGFVHPDRNGKELFPASIVVHVVEVAVRVPDGNQVRTRLLQFVHASDGFLALNRRINDNGFAALVIMQQVQVVGKGAYFKSLDVQTHGQLG